MFQGISKVRYFYCVIYQQLLDIDVRTNNCYYLDQKKIIFVVTQVKCEIKSILNLTSINRRYKSNANLYHCIHPITLLPWD